MNDNIYLKVFRNCYLNNKIFSNLSNKETNRYKYDEIIDVEKMLLKRISKFKHYTNEKTISRYGYHELLRLKVSRGDLLKFKMINDPIFQEYNNELEDYEFYENLFLNYPQYYKCKTTMNNIIQQDCSIALKVLFGSRELGHLKYNESLELESVKWFITSIIMGSIGVANLLLENNKLSFRNLTIKQQEIIWSNLIYERSRDTEKMKTIGSSIKFLTLVLHSKLPSNIKNITLSYNIDGSCTLQYIYDVCYCIATLFISLKPQQPISSSDNLIPLGMNKFFTIDQLDKLYKQELTSDELNCKLSNFDKHSCKPLIKELVLMAIWHGSNTFKILNLKFFKSKFCGTNNDHLDLLVDCIKFGDFIQLKKLIVRNRNSKIEIYDNETPFQYCRNDHGLIKQFIKFSINDISTNDQGNSNLKISIELLIELVLRFQDLPLFSFLLEQIKEKNIEFPIYKLDIQDIIKWINGSMEIVSLFDLVYGNIREKFNFVELLNSISNDKLLNGTIKIVLNHLKNNYNEDYKQFISKIPIGTYIKNDSFIFENVMDFKDNLLSNNYSMFGSNENRYMEISLEKFKYFYNDTTINDHQNNPKLFHWLLNNHPNDISTEPLESRFVFSLCIFDFNCHFDYNLEITILKIINSTNGNGVVVNNVSEIQVESLSSTIRKRLIYLTYIFVRSNRVDLFGYMWNHFSLIYQKDTIDHFCYFSIYHSNLEIINFILSNVKHCDINLPKIDKFDQFHQQYCLKYCIDNYLVCDNTHSKNK